MGDAGYLPEYQKPEWEVKREKSNPPGLVSYGFSSTSSPYWMTQLPGMGGNLIKRPNTPVTFNILGESENKAYTIEGASYAKSAHYEWHLLVVCPSDNRPRLPDDHDPDNPYPEDEEDMPCRYLKDLQQLVTVESFDEETGRFKPIQIRSHEAMIDSVKYISNEMKKINTRLDSLFHSLEAGELRSEDGLLIKPDFDIAAARKELKERKTIRVRSRREIEVAIAAQSDVPVASVPEWYAKRPGSSIPQLAVIFRPVNGTSSYTMHIPHYKGVIKNPKIPAYKKGNWRGEWILFDGTKFVVNALNQSEAKKVWAAVKLLIQPEYLKDVQEMSKPSNTQFNEVLVKPVYADFYSDGFKNSEPAWRAYLE
ncbi:MAG: hypothetical protein ACRC62_28945 [Microcoleus sp.]